MTKKDLKKARSALRQAIDAAGGQTHLANKIGTFQTNVNYWLYEAVKGVPPEWALKIERETGVERWKLCPHIFSPPVVPQDQQALAVA